MAIKHKFSSAIPDGLDPALVKPSDWNEDHFVDFEGLAKSVGGVLLQATAGVDYLRPDGSGAALTGITAAQVGLGNVTNESKATMFTSPVLTGTPTGPTAPVDTNSTQLATTEFFAGQAAIASPLAPADIAAVGTAIKFAREDHVHPTNFTTLSSDLKMNGSAAVGLSTKFSRADHVHPTDTSRAPVASPTFTGVVTGPQFVSTVATGTAPFVVASNTLVSNLNAQYLGGTPLSGLEPAITTLPVLKGGTGTTMATGSGSVVLSTSPTLVTPNIGVATGTSFNAITGLASTTPNMDGTAAIGTGTTVARADHVHPVDTSRQAALVSGTNIKTINGSSVLGTGDLPIPVLTDGDKGDITVGSGGTTFTVTEPTLAALKNVATAADKMIYATGVDTFSTATLTAFARTLLDDADAAAARATLGAQAAATAINTSNIGSQSVNYAASAGNADTLDGYHAASFLSSGSFSQAFSANGYQRLPSGLIIQWGITSATPTQDSGYPIGYFGYASITFPVAFPTSAPFSIQITPQNHGEGGVTATWQPPTTTGLTAVLHASQSGSAYGLFWLAIGH